MLAEVKGVRKVKRRVFIGIVLTLISILVFANIGAAENINVFEFFASRQQRLTAISDKSDLYSTASIHLNSNQWGNSTLSIANAYFDGDVLLLGYTIENPKEVDYFTPTMEIRNQMTNIDVQTSIEYANRMNDPLAEEYKKVVQDGSTLGIVSTEVVLADDLSCGETHLGTWNEMHNFIKPGIAATMRDYDELSEDICCKDNLAIQLTAYRRTIYLYYDGQDAFMLEKQDDAASAEVTVAKSEKIAYYFEGEAEICGTEVDVEATTSPLRLSIQIAAQNGAIPILPEGSYYDMNLLDEDGYLYEASAFEMRDDKTLVFIFNGSGHLPEQLSGHLIVIGDDGTESTGIALNKMN